MLIHLIAVLAIGFAAAGFVLMAWRLRGRRAPKSAWLTAAGVSMLAYGVWNEYSWAWRTTGALPEGVVVIEEFVVRSPLHPWTFLIPRVGRLIAVDTRAVRTNPALPGYVLTDLLLLERLEATLTVAQVVDCRDSRVASVPALPRFTETGLPDGLAWREIEADAPLAAAICAGR